MKRVFFILSILCFYYGFSQNSSTYIADIKLSNKADRWCWSICEDNNRLMYFGVSNGVIVYDGKRELFLNTGFTPTYMHFIASNNKIVIANNEQIGIINTDAYFKPSFLSLHKNFAGNLNQMKSFEKVSFFYGDSTLIRINHSIPDSIITIPFQDINIYGIFQLEDKFYAIGDYFPYLINNNELTPNEHLNFPVDEYSFVVNLNKDTVVIGNPYNELYFVTKTGFWKKYLKPHSYFNNNIILSADSYSPDEIILTSAAGGVAILNTKLLSITKNYSYYNGLADDEIRATFNKPNKLWVAHGLGISIVLKNSPLQKFHYFPGLKGSPLTANFINKNIYVGTTNGLFYLSEIKNYDESKIKVAKTITVPVKEIISAPETSVTPKAESKDKSRFLSLFKRKQENESTEPNTKQNQQAKTQYKTTYKTKTVNSQITKRNLKSVQYYFKFIEGTNDKCKFLLSFENYIINAGNNGLYAINNNKSETILKGLSIQDIAIDSLNKRLLCATNDGLYLVWLKDKVWKKDHIEATSGVFFKSIVKENGEFWSAIVDEKIFRFSIASPEIIIKHSISIKESPGMQFVLLRQENITLLATDRNIFEFNENGTINKRESLNKFYAFQKKLWHTSNNHWFRFSLNEEAKYPYLSYISDIRNISTDAKQNLWVITDENEIFRLENNCNQKQDSLCLSLLNLESNERSIDIEQNVILKASENQLKGTLSCPYYIKENPITFYAKLYASDTSWINLGLSEQFEFPYLKPGKYKIQFLAKDQLGNTSNSISINLKVKKPFTQTTAFALIIALLMGVLIWIIFMLRTKKLEKDKAILEEKVKCRTRTIEKQKNKIQQQKDDITNSIRYAERIQTAMLPHKEIIEALLPEHFILFMPRDIVSGDFYFFKPCNNHLVFAAADCTGHGVPGAFMSMLGISFLNEITTQIPEIKASDILNYLREKIKLTLQQSQNNSSLKDGMDISVCVIDIDNKTMQYSGAFNPLYIVKDGELESVKADRQPVAFYYQEKDFTNHQIKLEPNCTYYMFSDGFADQIGGPKEKKFKTKNFKSLLLDIHTKPLSEQHDILKTVITEWKGDQMQMDDILVTGFRI